MSASLAQSEMTIEGPAAPKAEVAIRREPVPRELEALGVKIAVDPVSDMQILIIPKELREKANVLAPIQAFQQADPNWRPSLRVVELDPDPVNGPHFYKQQGGRVAPRKQALELLADAAGVVQIRTTLMGRERVEVSSVIAETFTHLAILRIRKSDGTLRTLEASRTYEPFAEYEEIRTSVGSGQYAKTPGTPEYDAEVRKRWLNEIKFAKAKNESKAINRAIRAAIQSPQTYNPADAAKPFVVVGWNLAPQSSEAVQAAIAQLYGAAPEALEAAIPSAPEWDPPEEAHGELLQDDATEASSQVQVVAADPPPAVAAAPGEPDSAEVSQPPLADQAPEAVAAAPELPSSPAADGDQVDPEREPVDQAGDGEPGPRSSDASAPAPTTEPVIPGIAPVDATALSEAEMAKLPAALAVKIPSGSYQQRTLGWVLELGEAADEWLAYALRQPWPHDQGFKAALGLAVKAHRPVMFSAWRTEA